MAPNYRNFTIGKMSGEHENLRSFHGAASKEGHYTDSNRLAVLLFFPPSVADTIAIFDKVTGTSVYRAPAKASIHRTHGHANAPTSRNATEETDFAHLCIFPLSLVLFYAFVNQMCVLQRGAFI